MRETRAREEERRKGGFTELRRKQLLSLSLSFRVLTEREKRVRQKSHGDAELQAYEKRLKTIEAKLHLLSNRGTYSFLSAN